MRTAAYKIDAASSLRSTSVVAKQVPLAHSLLKFIKEKKKKVDECVRIFE